MLPGLGIDVILGMNWMKDHGVVIDTINRTIQLDAPNGCGTFQVPLLSNADLKSFSCAIHATDL